jgi:hypothetical protein
MISVVAGASNREGLLDEGLERAKEVRARETGASEVRLSAPSAGASSGEGLDPGIDTARVKVVLFEPGLV